MKKIIINENTSARVKKAIIRFLNKYGDGHITKKGIRWLDSIHFDQLKYDHGDLIHLFVEDKKIVAAFIVSQYGLNQAIITVHPSYRKTGIGYRIIDESFTTIDRLYVKIANDNVPSLKLAFALGMQAFDLTKGPTGKPTLILGTGNWSVKEWERYDTK